MLTLKARLFCTSSNIDRLINSRATSDLDTNLHL